MASYKEKRYTRIVEQFGELDEEQREAFYREIQGQKALSAIKEVKMAETTTFGQDYAQVEKDQQYFNKAEGLLTGLKYFDDATMGFRPGELTIIAGPSNFGKTAVGLNIVASLVANTLKKVVIISLEMTTREINSRLYNIVDKESHSALMNNIVIQKERRLTAAYISKIIKNQKPDLVFIDDLQSLAMREGGEEYERVSKGVATVKDIAIAHNIPIILVSHVSKQRSGKQGQATNADLRGSASIEQAADIVIMINRPKEGAQKAKEAIVTLTKHRTKRPVVFLDDCVVKFDGIRIGGDGDYYLFT
jgi:replicative DNA helicase